MLSGVVEQVRVRTVYDMRPQTHTYDNALGGYITNLEYEHLQGVREQIGDGRLFSTYAGALEYQMGQLQPSGYDYIIHVLGEEARETYLDVFYQGNFEYVSTMRPKYLYEPWVRNANWFFYRELYAAYEPAFFGDEQIFWAKSETGNGTTPPITFAITQAADGVVTLGNH